MTAHPTITNEVARLRSEEKVARGLAAYIAPGDEAPPRRLRLRDRRPWQSLSLSLGSTLLDVLDRRSTDEPRRTG
jgi:hypothetical protein